MKRVVIYTRVSTEEQVRRTSLDSQASICRDYCAREDMDVIRVFTDAGESARTTDRPAFKDLLKFCTQRSNGIDYVVAYRLDRLARNTHDSAVFRAALAKFGVALRSATEPVTDDPTGRFMTTILSAMAELDNDVRGERSKEGMKRIVERGGWTAKPPVGYRMGRNDANLPILVEDPACADLIRALFRMVGVHGYTETQAWEKIRAMGLRGARGGPLHRQSVHKFLRTPVYCGRIKNALTQGRILKSAFVPLLSEDLYDRAQLVLSGHGRPLERRRKVNGKFPLRHFVRCEQCGKPLTGSYAKGRNARYPYYHCRTAGCSGMIIPKEDLEKAFCGLLMDVGELSREVLTKFRKKVMEKWLTRHADVIKDQERMKERLKALEQQRSRLLDKFVEGAVDDALYEAKERQLALDIALVKSQVHDTQLDAAQVEEALNSAEFLLRNPDRLWLEANVEIRQRFQKLLFPKGLIYAKKTGFGTVVSDSAYGVLVQFAGCLSPMAPPRGVEPLFPG